MVDSTSAIGSASCPAGGKNIELLAQTVDSCNTTIIGQHAFVNNCTALGHNGVDFDYFATECTDFDYFATEYIDFDYFAGTCDSTSTSKHVIVNNCVALGLNCLDIDKSDVGKVRNACRTTTPPPVRWLHPLRLHRFSKSPNYTSTPFAFAPPAPTTPLRLIGWLCLLLTTYLMRRLKAMFAHGLRTSIPAPLRPPTGRSKSQRFRVSRQIFAVLTYLLSSCSATGGTNLRSFFANRSLPLPFVPAGSRTPANATANASRSVDPPNTSVNASTKTKKMKILYWQQDGSSSPEEGLTCAKDNEADERRKPGYKRLPGRNAQ